MLPSLTGWDGPNENAPEMTAGRDDRGRGLPSFKSLRFGYASAETEAAEDPQLLLAGYLDTTSGQASVKLPSSRFLVLGYKGSGKSAIAEHLKLQAATDPLLFVRIVYLSDFQFRAFDDLAASTGERRSGYGPAWTWLLLLQAVDSLSADSAAMEDQSLQAATKALRDADLLETGSLRSLTLASRKKSVSFTLPKVFQLSMEDRKQVERGNVTLLAERLLNVLSAVSAESQHYIALDGLDDLDLAKDSQQEALSALLMSAHRLNLRLRDAQVPVKFLVMCRTDLFEALPGANTNKLRRDVALELDWYSDTRHPEATSLVRLATFKARVAEPAIDDVFRRYLPTYLDGQRKVQTIRHLLEFTRHTPRDFLQLLKFVQESAPESSPLTIDHVLNGLRNYCRDYFMSEIRNEISGPLSPNDVTQVFEVLGALGQRRFDFEQLVATSQQTGRYRGPDLRVVLRLLFNCSAIGNWQSRARHDFFSFKYRNRHATLDLSRRFILHRAISRALGIPD
jgi:hypothetical protein